MVYINAISSYFPENFRTNTDVIKNYKKYSSTIDNAITEQSIFDKCGIKKRYFSNINESAKDLGIKSSEKLFNDWQIDSASIEYIIFVSDALDYKGPTTACIMQNDLGLSTSVQAIDVLHGCTGFIYGLSLAKALISSGQATNILLVTADIPSQIIHPEDIYLAAIFSDAAATTFISNQKIAKGLNIVINNFIFGTDGKGENDLFVARSGSKNPADTEWLQQYKHLPKGLLTGGRMYMNSDKIFLFAYKVVPKLIKDILERHKTSIEKIDYFVLHQANGVLLEFLRNKMKIPKEKFISNIENIGNTVSASIPIAIEHRFVNQKLEKEKTILIAGFGIGYSWGGTILKI